METLKTIAKRKSTRDFDQSKQIPKELINTVMAAGCAAPVGMGDRRSLHLTVIQAPAALASVNKNAQAVFKESRDFLYGATALVIVSASGEQKAPNIQYANAACVVENMLLAATDAGLASVYLWGAITGLAGDKELCTKLGIPDGFTPLSAAALGYSKETDTEEKKLSVSLSVNYV